MRIKGNYLLSAYLNEFVARCCCWAISSQLLVRLMQSHWSNTSNQLYLVGASISLLFLCTIFGGLIRDSISSERFVMFIGIAIVFIGNILFLFKPEIYYISLALIFIGAGLVTSSTPLVVLSSGEKNKNKAFTILYGFTNGGVILGSIVGGLLYKYISWNALLIGDIVFSAICILVNYFTFFLKDIMVLNLSLIKKLIVLFLVAFVLSFSYLKYQSIAELLLTISAICYLWFVVIVWLKNKIIRKELITAIIFIFFAIIFFSGEFQIASTLIDFSKNFVNLKIYGFSIPVGSLVALESFFVVIGAFLISRFTFFSNKFSPNSRVFFGLLLSLFAFILLDIFSHYANHHKLSVLYIVVIFFLFGVGDVLLTPPIMSYIATISPPASKGRLMAGTYFSFSVAGYLSGLIGEKVSHHYIKISNNIAFYQTIFTLMIFVMLAACVLYIIAMLSKLSLRLER